MKAFIPGIGTIDSSQKTLSKSLTDLEKWKKHLDEMGIKYKEEINKYDPSQQYIDIEIDEMHFDQSLYSASLNLQFDIQGNFMFFSPSGE